MSFAVLRNEALSPTSNNGLNIVRNEIKHLIHTMPLSQPSSTCQRKNFSLTFNFFSVPLKNSLVDLSPEHLRTVQRILEQFVPQYGVAMFGSRVHGKAKSTSDIDLVIMNDVPMETTVFSQLQDAFSHSRLPMKVDVVEWARTQETFRKIIEEKNIKIR